MGRRGIPLLRNPREVVSGLHSRHRPRPDTAIVAVLDPDERLRASASFVRRPAPADGWMFRNALLAQLRRVIPHDLRRRTPVRTAVLLYCREGDARWTEEDGAWMWGLRDACTLHGLRCGAYITLTREGWQVLGEGRADVGPARTRRRSPWKPSRRPRPFSHVPVARPRRCCAARRPAEAEPARPPHGHRSVSGRSPLSAGRTGRRTVTDTGLAEARQARHRRPRIARGPTGAPNPHRARAQGHGRCKKPAGVRGCSAHAGAHARSKSTRATTPRHAHAASTRTALQTRATARLNGHTPTSRT